MDARNVHDLATVIEREPIGMSEGYRSMNRRSFALALVSLPVGARLTYLEAMLDGNRLSRWRHFESSAGMFAALGVGVRLHISEEDAERARRADLANPFGRTPGEFYPGPPHEVLLDGSLPGNIRRYDAVIGVAAVERTIVVGAFRRGQFTWSVRVIEGPETYGVEAGKAIAAFELPDPVMTWLEPGVLENLLPAADDFSGDVRVLPGQT